MKLSYSEAGPPDGPPVFFLHGLLGSASNWLPTTARLSRRGFRCLGVDQRNHGRSPRAGTMDYPSMAGDLFELADDLGIRRFSLVGHSMGGKAAMEAALEEPSRVAGLVVVDIAPVAYPPRYSEWLAALKALDLREIGNKSEADDALRPAIADERMRLFLLANLVRRDAGYSWRIDLDAILANYGSIWAALPGGRSYSGPALVLRGSLSDYVDEDRLELTRALFPALDCAVVEGAGHWVPTDRPEAFMDEVEGFLARIPR